MWFYSAFRNSAKPPTSKRVGAFASCTITEQPKVDDDIPFSTLLQPNTDTNANKQVNKIYCIYSNTARVSN